MTLPTIKELELRAMKYEYTLQKHMNLYFKDPKKNKTDFKIAIRASKEANKLWRKVAFLERQKFNPWDK
jgi:hypothetical protein